MSLLQACEAGGELSAPLKPSQRDALSRLRRGLPPKQGAVGWGDDLVVLD